MCLVYIVVTFEEGPHLKNENSSKIELNHTSFSGLFIFPFKIYSFSFVLKNI
jgi:hypothetical protein